MGSSRLSLIQGHWEPGCTRRRPVAYLLGGFRFLQLPREYCTPCCTLLFPLVLCNQDHFHSLAPAPSFPRMWHHHFTLLWRIIFLLSRVSSRGINTNYFLFLIRAHKLSTSLSSNQCSPTSNLLLFTNSQPLPLQMAFATVCIRQRPIKFVRSYFFSPFTLRSAKCFFLQH